MTSEKKMLENRIHRIEESMVRMTDLVETLVKTWSQPLLLTDAEQADLLRARPRADDEETATEQDARGTTAVARDRNSGGESTYKAHNPHNRWRAALRRPAAYSEGARLLPDQAALSRPAAKGSRTPA